MKRAEQFFRRRFPPQRYWNQVETQAVQKHLQKAFERWGLPGCLRFDNGKPWGNPAAPRVPSVLALWLVGLGIRLVFGRPRQSTDNAVVERAHGVLVAWVEPTTCADRKVLAYRLAHFSQLQRELYPACQGCSRLQAFPDLLIPRQLYRSTQDAQRWQLERALAYLAQFTFARRVQKNGRITLMTQEYSLRSAFRAQTVTVRLDPLRACWCIADRHGTLLKAFPAAQLTYSIIASMQLTHPAFKANRQLVHSGV